MLLNFLGHIKSTNKHVSPRSVLVLLNVVDDICSSDKELPNNGSIWERMINTPIPEVKPDITGYETKVNYPATKDHGASANLN